VCDWRTPQAVPHESKFSRAFGRFAASQLPPQLHQAVVAATQGERVVGPIARDATAIPVRERFPEKAEPRKKDK
jgi:hypothetical protein